MAGVCFNFTGRLLGGAKTPKGVILPKVTREL